jgi:hypothetical protein
MLPVNQPDHEKPWFILGFCRNLKQHRVIPEPLSLSEINAMLGAIGFALCSVKFERIHGIKIIPLMNRRVTTQAPSFQP